METGLIAAVMAAANILCFLVGARVGQQTAKGEEVRMPAVDPMKAIREHSAKQEADREQLKINTILQNIEAYDGTAAGQKDVPR